MDQSLIKLIREGKAAAEDGREAEARRLFEAVLSEDPDNGAALLWMAWLSENPRASLSYANRALALYPDNARVRAAQAWAQSRVAPSDTHGPVPPEPVKAKPERRWRRLAPIAALASLGAFFAGMLLILAWYAPEQIPVIAGWGATATPTPTATATPHSPSLTPTTAPTSTPTVTAAPTETATPTSSPTATPSPSVTPVPTETPTPTPGETPQANVPVGDDVRWINVDLSQQLLTAYEGETPVRTIVVSTGLPRTPTPVGQYRIYIKLLKTDMRGPDYHLRDVPYTMYFYQGYGIHGTYWHSNFGEPMSAGCINLPTDEAEWLFHWASVGTLVNIHQ